MLLLNFGYFVLKNNPKNTGNNTTFITERIKSDILIATELPTKNDVNNGVITIAAIVDAVVINTDNAISALAIKVTIKRNE